MKFKINRLVVKGPYQCDHIFKKGLNVIEGYHDTGKTNLLEILRFALGGKATHVDDSIYEKYEKTFCEIELDSDIYTLKRNKSRTGKVIRIAKKKYGEINENTEWDKIYKNKLSKLVLNTFNISGTYDRGRKIGETEISFYMLYNLIYIPQRNWNGIQEKQQIYNAYDRIATFKYALGISDEKLNQLKIKRRKLKGEREKYGEKRKLLESILEENIKKDPNEIKKGIIKVKVRLEKIENKINNYKETKDTLYKENIEEYKEELKKISKLYKRKDNELLIINNRIEDLLDFKLELEEKLSSLTFQEKSFQLFQGIPFKACPSCGRELKDMSKSNYCSLCKRKLNERGAKIEKERKTDYLRDTIREIETNIKILYKDIEDIEEEMDHLMEKQDNYRELIKKNIKIDTIPIIDDLENLYIEKSKVQKELERNKSHLKMWQVNKSITRKIKEIEQEIDVVRKKISNFEKKLTNQQKIKEFTKVFKNYLKNFTEIREYDNIKLSQNNDETDYLPLINDKLYTKDTGDAEKVIIITIYYLTLLNLFEKGISKFPPFLIIDTPRQQELSERDYKKLLELFYETSKNLQIIICVTEKVPIDENKYNRIPIDNYTLNPS